MDEFMELICVERTEHWELFLSSHGDEALTIHLPDMPPAAWDAMSALVSRLGFEHSEFGGIDLDDPCKGLGGYVDCEFWSVAADEVAALEASWHADMAGEGHALNPGMQCYAFDEGGTECL